MVVRVKKFFLFLPKWFFFFLFVSFFLSVITISSASLYLSSDLGNLVLKQAIWFIFGILVLFGVKFLGLKRIFQITPYGYWFCVFLLLLLFPFGTEVNNSKCWFVFPGIGSFQPSEFMKIFLLLMLARSTYLFFQKHPNPTWKEEFWYLIKMGLLTLVPSVFTFLEPDTGAVLIYFIILGMVLLGSGIRKQWFFLFFSLLLCAIGGILFLYYQKQDLLISLFGNQMFYRIDRLLDWQSGTGFQLENALIAIGSAGLFGHGYKNTPVYFPESGTDFIFAVFASNFGLIASILFLLFLLFFDLYLLHLARANTISLFSKLTILGIVGILVFQQVQNIGMTIGLFPIMGITLPFISYGGSSLLSYMIFMGMIYQIAEKEKAETRF